jgi:hypothetical protein
MSINHLINEDAVPKYDIFTNDIKLDEDGKIENAKVKVANGDIVDLSSLASYGAPSERLTSLGNGQLAWVAGAGTSGIEYGGVVPVALNTLAKYSATDGSIVDKTTFVDTDILLKNGSVAMTGNLDINNNNILNSNNVYTKTLFATAPAIEIQVENNLRMRQNDIVDVDNVDANISVSTLETKTNQISTNTGVNVQFNNNINLFGNDILAGQNIQTRTLSSTDFKSQEIDANCHLDFDTLFDVRNVATLTATNVDTGTTSTLVLNSGISPDLDVNTNLNLDSLYEIKGVTNVQTTDINTDTISANAPATSVLMQNDLDLNGNNIIGLSTINGIQASGGVYSNTGGFSFSGITAETDILASGSSYGSRMVPANAFSAGDIYTLKIGGQITCANNDTFDIRIVSNFGLPSEAEFSSFTIQIDGAQTNGFFEIEVDFSLRAVGGAGVAIITTNGDFTYYNNTNVQKGFGISSINNTTFNTTIDNELSITYATGVAISSFQIDQSSLMKFF